MTLNRLTDFKEQRQTKRYANTDSGMLLFQAEEDSAAERN